VHDEAEHLTGVVLRCFAALDARDLPKLERLLTAGMLAEVKQAWAGRRRVGLPTLRFPEVGIVGVDDSRAVAELKFAGGVSPLTGVARRKETERWTLRPDGDRWKLAALTGSALDDGLAAAAAFELAAADGAPDEALKAKLTGERDVRVALNDLAMLDERFAWHVIEHVVERLSAAWVDAAQLGRPDPLLVHASETATGVLLGSAPVRPTHVEPLAVRGGRVLLAVDAMRWRLVADASRPGGWRLDAVS
jgi:hypothetical protein